MNLWNMSISGGIFIMAVVIIRSLLVDRLPRKVFQVLWLAAFLRLVIPFSIPCRFSIYSLTEMYLTDFSGNGIYENEASFYNLDEMDNMAAYADSAWNESTETSKWEFSSIWLYIYMGGASLCVLYYALSYFKWYREFQFSLPIENQEIQAWADALPIRRKVSVRQWDMTATPLTYGMVHPVILLPKTLCKNNTGQVRFVLLHEYMHIRHFDALKKMLLTLACCIHWFNPLVWVMVILANRDMELDCDENVIKYVGRTMRSAYASALIELEEQRSLCLPLGNSFNKNAIEERVIAIMKDKKKSITIGVLSGVLTAGLILVFTTSAYAINRSEMRGDTVITESSIIADDSSDSSIATYEIDSASYPLSQIRVTTPPSDKVYTIASVSADEHITVEYCDTDSYAENILKEAEQNTGIKSSATASTIASEPELQHESSYTTVYAAEGVDAAASAGEYPNDIFIDVPDEYASCGITSDPKTAGWEYQGKLIAVLYDKGKYLITNDVPEKNAIYLEVRRNKIGGIKEFKELTKEEMQKLVESTGLVIE